MDSEAIDDGRAGARRSMLVTGGARGLGAAIARTAAERGFDVVTIDVDPVTWTDSMPTASTGRSPGPVAVVAMASTTSRELWSATSPKIVCLKFSQVVGATVMKNCEPFVPGPALAIASR